MIEKILDKYKLKLNRKTKIYKNREGIEFLGFRFLISNKIIMRVRKSTKKRFKKNLSEKNISSYLGHLGHGNCGNLIYCTLNNRLNKKT